uniref:Uncharacterized protein n=1 Tax=Aegilops tauschii subsp. strangulata TaxID=200361 RepID=A0A453F7W7_AEGTS
ARAHADESVGQRARDRDMSAVSWSIPAIPRAIPPARSGPPGEAFLVAARPRAARSRAAPRRVRLARGGVVVAHAGAAEVPVADSGEAAVVFSEKFPLRRCQTVTSSMPRRVKLWIVPLFFLLHFILAGTYL